MSLFVLTQFVLRLSRLVREQGCKGLLESELAVFSLFCFGFVLKPQSCEPQASVRLISKKNFKDFVGLANGRREERRPALAVLRSRYQSGKSERPPAKNAGF